MRIALTGASGFIGSNIARLLSERGHKVTALVRQTSRRDHVEPFVDRFVIGTHDDESRWPQLLDGADAVIHNSVDWAPLRGETDLAEHLRSNLTASIRFLHTSSPRPFLFVSTIAVHHDMRPRWDGLVDEDHPTRPGGLYGAYKAAVEAHLWADIHSNGRQAAAIRPCAVYGIDPKLDRSIGHRVLADLSRERKYNRPGGGKYVHVEDVAAAAANIIDREDGWNAVYNLADCYARWADWADMAASLLGIEAEIDRSSPPEPKNTFIKDEARRIGVNLDRGHEGLKTHLAELMERMREAGDL